MTSPAIDETFPLSPLQEGMLFQHIYTGRPGVDLLQVSVELRHSLDMASLERAWKQVIARHPALRTAFVHEGLEQPMQEVWNHVPFRLDFKDLSALPSTEKQKFILDYERADRQRGFSTLAAPLMRAIVFKRSDHDFRLLWSVHHMIADGRACHLVLQEMFEVYDAAKQGRPPTLFLSPGFREYVEWVNHLELSRASEFWRERLKGFANPTPILKETSTSVLSQGPEAVRTEQSIWLPEGLSSKVRELVRSSQLTLNTLMQGVWAILLSRYSGEEDIVFGASKTTRHAFPGADAIIGNLIVTLPVRTIVRSDAPLIGWLKALRAEWISMREFEHTPLSAIQQATEISGGEALFNTLVIFENGAFDDGLKANGGEWQKRSARLVSADTNYALTLMVYGGEDIELRIGYDSREFALATIERMLGHLRTMLEALAESPNLTIAELPMLPAAERQQILVDFNATAMGYPRDALVGSLIEAQVERTPEAVAVRFGEQSITYRELNEQANQLARELQQRGAAPDVLIGIYVERSIEMMVGLLAIMKAGAAYLPLDPFLPQDRLRYMVEDSGLKLLLTEGPLLSSLPESAAKAVLLDDPLWRNHDKGNLNVAVGPESLGYVRYTSGSTGKPKGVMVPQGSVVNFMESMRRKPGIVQEDTLVAVTTLSFDISELELWLPLCSGAKVVIAGRESAMDGFQLAALLRSGGATVMQATPATWRILLDSGWRDTKLKALCGGEALAGSLAEELLPRCAELWNLYGPTETTIWSTGYQVRDGHQPILIGKPVGNTKCYILDQARQPVPIGVAGELYIAGDGLARGYLNRPELTAEKFIADPFAKNTEARMYRTGDLARYHEDGDIECLGRTDHQVKIRGYRIELGEIENALKDQAGIRQAVVIAREDRPDDKRLVAYLVCTEAGGAEREQLRSALKKNLPDYMIPAEFVMLDQIPISPNGKIDRKALPAPDYTRNKEIGEYRAAGTAAEEIIAGIWAEVLRLDRVGVEDDFFALGGHSLLAMQVVSRIRGAFGVDLPLRTLFEAATVSRLALKVESLRREYRAEEKPLVRADRTRPLPLSYAQQRLWFLDQLEPDNPFYNVPQISRLTGKVDVPALEWALNQVVKRQEALRTTVRAIDGQAVQVIAPELSVKIQYTDLTWLSSEEREVEGKRQAMAEAQRSFDLSADPMLRAALFAVSEREHLFVLTMHHIVSDQWAVGILVRELTKFYQVRVTGKEVALPELRVQYADYAVWQRETMSGELLETQLDYWKHQLEGMPPTVELATDRPRPPVQTYRGALKWYSLPKTLTHDLARLSRKEGVTLFMTLLAAFEVVLSRWSGQDDLMVGTPIANRNRAELEEIIGYFANTIVLRTKLDGNPTFRELLSRVKEMALSAFAHQDIPFERLVEELHPARSLSYGPLVQIYFVLQNAPASALELSGLSMRPMEAETKTARGELFLSANQTAEGIDWRVEYSTDLFDEASIERMMGHYERVLEVIAESPNLTIGELPMLTAAEREQLLVEWNETERGYVGKCLHEVIGEQATRRGEAVAVVAPDGELSYGELERRANQLAHALLERGVKRGERVGVYLERTQGLLVGLLGVLKTGAAYVPLDPTYPAERIRLTLEDADVKLVVSQKRLVESLPYGGEVLCLDREASELAGRSEADPEIGVSLDDLAYVIFTSGSTGRPKGVEVRHRGVVNLMCSMAKELEINEADVFPALASFAFDMSVPELYLTLTVGGRVLLGKSGLGGNGEELAEYLKQHGATVVHATPTTWSLLLDAGYTGAGMKRCIGAEPLPKELFERLMEAAPGTPLWNFYGPTETTVWSTCHEFHSKDEPIVIGRPLANTQVYIVDRYGQPCPIGVPGEIYIGGDGVARGYRNRAELTEEKFISNSFTSDGTLYCTGDLGRYLPDGDIECLGRTDHQVKIRGYRIELGEIESVLSAHPGVKECVVMAREDVPGDKRLAAYVVPQAVAVLDHADLREWVKERLPEYMVPAMVLLGKLPISPNGKIDRKALPAPDMDSLVDDRAYVAPRTKLEADIAKVWEQILGLQQVGATDNFFELGGHSLKATRLTAKLREELGIELRLSQLFQTPTVEQLAIAISKDVRSQPPATLVQIPVRAEGSEAVLSFGQERLWLLQMLAPKSAAYNITITLQLTGSLDVDSFRRAFNIAVERHQVLRTRYVRQRGGGPTAVINDLAPNIAFQDLETVLSLGERDQIMNDFVQAQARIPFKLDRDAVLRATLIRVTPEEHVLSVVIHHIAADGWSVNSLLRDISVAYDTLKKNVKFEFPPLPVQYSDFAKWQREQLTTEVVEAELEFWRAFIADTPLELNIPTDHARPERPGYAGSRLSFEITSEISSEIRRFARVEKATLFAVLLAGFELLLSRESGQDRFTIGIPVAGRSTQGLDQVCGFFVNTLVIPCDVNPGLTFRELVKATQHAAFSAITHPDLPFEKVAEAIAKDRGGNPAMFNVFFSLESESGADFTNVGLESRPIATDTGATKFDLAFYMGEIGGKLTILVEYSTVIVLSSSIESLVSKYVQLLSASTQEADVTIGWTMKSAAH